MPLGVGAFSGRGAASAAASSVGELQAPDRRPAGPLQGEVVDMTRFPEHIAANGIPTANASAASPTCRLRHLLAPKLGSTVERPLDVFVPPTYVATARMPKHRTLGPMSRVRSNTTGTERRRMTTRQRRSGTLHPERVIKN
ncbi:hypothetical protein B0H14DRAFT_3515964 [Mycena olivaceomarginata]|nr:hypothetical protein B0H14DRAFT_3515964 [Mycena olivaceomarginata]